MSPKVTKRNFDPFFTNKDIGAGVGMGLAVIHGVVTSHECVVRVDGQKGVGMTFTIYVPCSSVPVPFQQVLSVPFSYCGKGKVMFVDDEVSINKWGKDVLEDMCYFMVVFTSGSEALQAFRKNPDQSDVIVTDLTMPGMTGEFLAHPVLSICREFPVFFVFRI